MTAPEDLSHDQPVVDQDLIRDLILRAHPDVVPDLIQGETVTDLLASVEPARNAFAAAAERIRSSQPEPVSTVPAGGSTGVAIDPARLPGVERIKRGLAARTTRSVRSL